MTTHIGRCLIAGVLITIIIISMALRMPVVTTATSMVAFYWGALEWLADRPMREARRRNSR